MLHLRGAVAVPESHRLPMRVQRSMHQFVPGLNVGARLHQSLDDFDAAIDGRPEQRCSPFLTARSSDDVSQVHLQQSFGR